MSELKTLRGARGLSLRTLAERVGCSHEQIRRLETNGVGPQTDRDTVVRIAAALGEGLTDVFPETAAMPEFQPPASRARALQVGPWQEAAV
ncbi:MAG TPA: helix-turn-helix transcriptional regulator [Propionibacteriaceae bacterium]|nr:helix-turn-helix transcriptional regulator [Propionibacteriaceae bacterium]